MITTLIYSGPGGGKTSLLATAPGPILVLDVENKAKHIFPKAVAWSDLSKPPPGLTEESVILLPLRDFADIEMISKLLRRDHWMRTIAVDSITLLDQKLLTDIVKGEEPARKSYLTLQLQMSLLTTAVAESTADLGVYIAWKDETEKGVAFPKMTKTVGKNLGHLVDIIGVLANQTDDDYNVIRTLIITPDDKKWQAKCQFKSVYEKLGRAIATPSLTEILKATTSEEK